MFFEQCGKVKGSVPVRDSATALDVKSGHADRGNTCYRVVRVLAVVATSAAAYYFIVRPVLDTTEKVSRYQQQHPAKSGRGK